MKTIHSFFLSLAICLLLSGCVTGRRTISPKVPSATLAATKGSVTLRSVVDERHFENKPSDPSTPSVKGKVEEMTAQEREVMVGRQRNGYGHAIGDIALENGETVLSKTRELVSAGFARRGYATSANPSAGNYVDVRIDQFWAWFTPGFWSLDFEARIECTISVKGRTFIVKGYGKNGGQMASDTNWEQAYEATFDDFLKNLESQLAQGGF